MKIGCIHPLPHLVVGMRVQALFGDTEEWFPGTLMAEHDGGASFDVQYDDGDNELGVPIDAIRLY